MKVWNPSQYLVIFISVFFSFYSPQRLMAKPAKDRVIYRIGFIHPRSGPLAPFGNSLSQGVKLGLMQFRAENPKLGDQVALVAADDHGLASEAEKVAMRLVTQQKANILIGSLSNVANQSISSVSSKTETILILPRGTDEDVISHPFVYSMSSTDRRQGQILAQFALKSLRRDRAALFIDSRNPDSEAIGKGFSDAFTQGGGQMLGQWSSDGNNLREVLDKIAAAQPNIVIYPGSYRGIGNVLSEARKAGIKATFLGSDGWDHEDLYRLNEELGSQYYFAYFHNNDPLAGVQSFVTDYESNFGQKPDVLAALGYDAVRAALQAFLLAKSPQTQALQKTFEGARFPSIYGAGRFAKDHVFLRPYPLMITTGGQARLMSRVLLEE